MRDVWRKVSIQLLLVTYFDTSQVVKNPPINAGDTGGMSSIPGLGRSLGEGTGNPLQYSCLENPIQRGTWRATVHEVPKSQTLQTELHTHISISIPPRPFSVCLPSDALSQHLPSYLGFPYLGRGVSLHGCSRKAQPLLLTSICQQIWKTQQWPQDWKRSVLIPHRRPS